MTPRAPSLASITISVSVLLVEREGGKVVVPEEEVNERVGGQGGKEKGCSYLMKTFLNSTVESSEDFCRCFSVTCIFKSFRRETISLQPR